MEFGDSTADVTRPGPDETAVRGTAGTGGDPEQARSPRAQEPVQAIQDIIDKLTVVTRQLGSPRRSPGPVPGPTR